jgi:Na+-driven multidrug efflux pump
MEFIRNIIKEVSTLYGIMLYSILVNFSDASFLLVDVIMLGHLGKGHLSAAFLSFAFYNICWYLLEGMLTAEDNLLSRAFHLHDMVSVRYWTYISFIVVIILCLVTSILFIFSAIIIQFMFNIPQHIALKSAEFLFLLLPGFFFHALYRVVQKYLHSQQDTRIPLICGGIGVVSNIIGATLDYYHFIGRQMHSCYSCLIAIQVTASLCSFADWDSQDVA